MEKVTDRFVVTIWGSLCKNGFNCHTRDAGKGWIQRRWRGLQMRTLFFMHFRVWTSELQDALNGRKRGDTAFRGKNFNGAIDSYTSVSTGNFEYGCYRFSAWKSTDVKLIWNWCWPSVLLLNGCLPSSWWRQLLQNSSLGAQSRCISGHVTPNKKSDQKGTRHQELLFKGEAVGLVESQMLQQGLRQGILVTEKRAQ